MSGLNQHTANVSDSLQSPVSSNLTPSAKSEETIDCPLCEGRGFDVDVRAVCCGRWDYESGDCCGSPDPEEEQVPCGYCETTGQKEAKQVVLDKLSGVI